MNTRRRMMIPLLVLAAVWAMPVAADDILPDNDVILRALVDEMTRSMDLQMEDLDKPYFIQYTVEDAIFYHVSAAYGSLIESDRDRSRDFYSKVRVGSYELDNTNFAGGGGFGFGGGGSGGGSATLPIEDDYRAIRQAIWWATDGDYKDAVETLTKKRAYMEDKNLADRPNDFSEAASVQVIEPGAELRFDKRQWESNLRRLSGHFKRYEQIQDSKAQLFVGAGNTFIVNSEGTRLRTGDEGVLLSISAEVQGDDGMRISDGRMYTGETTADLPPMETLLQDIDALVADLTAVMNAPPLEQYTGPVLFDDVAAAQMFRKLLVPGVSGKVDPVGTQRRRFEGARNLEKKIGRRILPDSFQVYDDPTIKKFDDTSLFGHFRYDDEGVPAKRVDIVVDGVLKNMVLSRVPTKKLAGSNGHARRSSGGGEIQAAAGCVFIRDDEGVSDEELKTKLIEAAEDEGLDYALRVASVRTAGIGASRNDLLAMFMRMQRGGGASLGDPTYVYKVYVDDGHEELVRGVEFGAVEIRALKDILAGGKKQSVYNYIDVGFGGSSPPSSIIAPAVLFEELDLSKIEQEHDKLPILKAPSTRPSAAAERSSEG